MESWLSLSGGPCLEAGGAGTFRKVASEVEQTLGDGMVSEQVRSHRPVLQLQVAKPLGPGLDPEVGRVKGGCLLPGPARCVEAEG